jgi:hypothetical protein
MKSASINSALEIFFKFFAMMEFFFKFFAMKSALKIFSNFSQKINIQTTDRLVQKFWGLEIWVWGLDG